MKSFEEMYEKVKNNSESIIEKERKKIIYLVVIIVLLMSSAFVFNILKPINNLRILMILIPIAFLICISLYFRYKKIFKERVLQDLVKSVDEGLTYNLSGTGNEMMQEYNICNWENYDRYSNEDYITGYMTSKSGQKYEMHMCEVNTQDRHTDKEGRTHYTTIYQGLYLVAKMDKAYNGSIKILNQSNFDGIFSSQNMKVNLDSPEFEKIYNVYSQDQIRARQLLTADIMANILDFRRVVNKDVDIAIKDNIIYLRIHSGPILEPKVFSNPISKEILAFYYNILKFSCELPILIEKGMEHTY